VCTKTLLWFSSFTAGRSVVGSHKTRGSAYATPGLQVCCLTPVVQRFAVVLRSSKGTEVISGLNLIWLMTGASGRLCEHGSTKRGGFLDQLRTYSIIFWGRTLLHGVGFLGPLSKKFCKIFKAPGILYGMEIVLMASAVRVIGGGEVVCNGTSAFRSSGRWVMYFKCCWLQGTHAAVYRNSYTVSRPVVQPPCNKN
jgi:hypothetical protein